MTTTIGYHDAEELNQWLIIQMSRSGGDRYTEGRKGAAWMEVLHQLAKEVIPSAPKVRKGFSRKYAVAAAASGVDPERIKAAYLLIFG